MINSANRHPPALSTLFFTEMWERFSYYGMRALLVLYLVNALEIPRDQALGIYATYTALVYLTPIIGGFIADKWLGSRRAVVVGGIIMSMGHFAMAFPDFLYGALALLIIGNGFFKPNISTLVGSLYSENDSRRDGGFTLFYMGINLGAFLAPLVCGTLGEKVDWHYGFAAAGVGMLVGLVVFIRGQHRLGEIGFSPTDTVRSQSQFVAQDWRIIGIACASVLVLVANGALLWPWLTDLWNQVGLVGIIVLGAIFLIVAAYWPNQKPTTLTADEKSRLVAVVTMAVFVIFFWMGFEQAGGTMNLFADTQTDRSAFGFEIPASYFQAVNPLIIILLAPVFSVLWIRLDKSRFAPSAVIKQALGMIILGLGFVVLAIAQTRAEQHGMVGPQWLLAVYFLHTVGELFLSPIGLSMVTKLAPLRLTAFIMGLWFTAIAVANYLAGTLESMLTGSGVPLYWFLVGSSMGAGLVLLIISPVLHRLMRGVR